MSDDLSTILERSVEGDKLSYDDIYTLLSVNDASALENIFQAAREVKERHFGQNVYLYGFIYFSTYCRNDCSFCYYRRTNDIPRYRKSLDDIITIAEQLEDSGINLVDLTMGEDPTMNSSKGYRNLMELVSKVHNNIDLPLMISPGALPQDAFKQLRTAGADWFACYQETHNRELFRRLRLNQDYDFRLNQKIWAKQTGMMIEEGIMIGVGEDIKDRVHSILKMKEIGASQVRAMTFIPQSGTPMSRIPTFDSIEEIKTIAVMRLVHQDKLIPASLDLEGLNGVRARLLAGANVITSIVPPQKTLHGVAQHDLDIENGNRSPYHIECELDELGMKVASHNHYNSFMEKCRDTGV